MPRSPGGRWTWAAPLLLFLAILLVAGLAFNLAYLDTGGEQVPSAPNAGGTPANSTGIQVIDVVRTAGVLILLGAVFVLVYMSMRRRRKRPRGELPPMSYTDIIATLMAMGMFILLIYLWPTVARQISPANATSAPSNGSGNGTALGTVAGVPPGVFLAGGLLAALLVIALLLRPSFRRPVQPEFAPRPSRQEAAAAVAVAIQDLELGGDVRETILGCFRRFCEILGQRGVQNQAPMTPRELEDLAVRAFFVPRAAADDLTEVFEEARYSRHPLGDADRERAVRSLQGIQAVLGG